MFAKIGDRLVVRSQHLDGPTRDGEIIEVKHADGSPRWRPLQHGQCGRRKIIGPFLMAGGRQVFKKMMRFTKQ